MTKTHADSGLAAFRHVLVPTDGSREAAHGLETAIALARDMGARLHTVYLTPKTEPDYGLGAIEGGNLLVDHFNAVADAKAREILSAAKASADTAGVSCEGETAPADDMWPALLRIAADRRCDLIVVAPHVGAKADMPSDPAVSILIVR